MEEMNVAFNMRTILLKLPYKLRDKWRNRKYELQEQHGHRARFPDLVDFTKRHVKILSDPILGHILDAYSVSTVKGFTFTAREMLRLKGSSFATN